MQRLTIMRVIIHQRRSIKSTIAKLKDVTIGESMEECALVMGQRGQRSDADLKGAKIMSTMEEFA